jgi:hypothetical protein
MIGSTLLSPHTKPMAMAKNRHKAHSMLLIIIVFFMGTISFAFFVLVL